MRERANELLTISKNLFSNWESRDFPINRIVISGSGAKYENLESLVKYIFQYFVYKSHDYHNSSIISLKNLDKNYKELYLSGMATESNNINFNSIRH